MYNRRYEKVFLMLRQETAGYALGKRPPWGSCVMELKNGKGRLHLTMQGLRPLRYEVYVMAGEESVFCGAVYPEKKEGRCELKWDFDPDAVGDGKKAEDFHTVILLAEGLSAPLTAYFKEKRNWKKDFVPEKKEQTEQEEILLQAAEAVTPEKPAPVVVMEKGEEQKDTNAKVAEAQKDRSQGSVHGSFQGLLAKFRQELEELEETGILSHEETEQIRGMGENPVPPSVEMQEAGKEPHAEPKGMTFAANRKLSPFGDGEQWKCLSLEEMTLLSQIPLKWQREFFFLLPDRKYHHLILQEKENGIWLGLPNHYSEADAADAETFGFGEFRRVDGDWGYWMCFLEREG